MPSGRGIKYAHPTRCARRVAGSGHRAGSAGPVARAKWPVTCGRAIRAPGSEAAAAKAAQQNRGFSNTRTLIADGIAGQFAAYRPTNSALAYAPQAGAGRDLFRLRPRAFRRANRGRQGKEKLGALCLCARVCEGIGLSCHRSKKKMSQMRCIPYVKLAERRNRQAF
jgi:hypothetical protein